MFKLDQKETFGGWCDVIRCHTESDFKMLLFVCLIHRGDGGENFGCK